jgi:methyl-accepting chemotaxis protein
VDAVKLLFSRAREARASLTAAREALEQIRLVALNAGLEGARLGDPAGKPLVLVAEEVRAHAIRAMSALEQHSGSLDQMDKERDRLRDQVEGAQQRTAEVARDLLQTQARERDVSTALAEVAERMKQVTQTDPETARLVADAADHARALMAALSSLTTRPHRTSLLGSLGPTLGPLVKLLREQYRGEPGGES